MATSIMHDAFMASTRTTPASLGDLPLELHQQILSYLPWKDQLNCEHVCRVWREDLRTRSAKPRSIVAPWLPKQDFDLALYGAPTIHTLVDVTNIKPFNFKCREGYKLCPGAPVVDKSIFQELGEAFLTGGEGDDDEHIEPVQCIYSFNFLERSGKGADAVLVECPVINLSFLKDMLVEPAFFHEDDIKKLYCRFSRLELLEPKKKEKKSGEDVENSETSNQMTVDDDDEDDNDDNNNNDDGNDGDGDNGDNDNDDFDDGEDNSSEDEEEEEVDIGPPRQAVSSGNFTSNVNLNPGSGTDTIFHRLPLGALLVQMRDHLLKDIFRLQGIEASNTTYPPDLGGEEIMRLDAERARKRKEYENGTVVIEQLRTERCSENQALKIAFNGMIVPEKTVDPALEGIGATSEH